MPTLVGQAYYLKNDWRGVERFEKSQIAANEKKGGARPTRRCSCC